MHHRRHRERPEYSRIDVEVEPELFVHHRDARPFGVTLALHIEGDPIEAAPTITKALAAVDPTQSILSVKTPGKRWPNPLRRDGSNFTPLGTFAVVATVLAALGVNAVIVYTVAERTHEMGIRLALGAERGRVVRMIVKTGDGQRHCGNCDGRCGGARGQPADGGPAVWRGGKRCANVYDGGPVAPGDRICGVRGARASSGVRRAEHRTAIGVAAGQGGGQGKWGG